MIHPKKFACFFLLLFIYASSNSTEKYIHYSRTGAGFFAELHAVMYNVVLFLFNEPQGKEIDVQWVDQFFPYKDDKYENGWDLFFYPIGHVQRTKDIKPNEIDHEWTCLKKWLKYDEFYTYRMGMHKVMNKYIRIKQDIIDAVDAYYNKYMRDMILIGVHVRFAAAHSAEKPGPISVEDYFYAVDELVRNVDKEYKIYLATDSQYVVRRFQERYGNKMLFIDAIRSSYNGEVHLIYENPNYWLNHPNEFQKQKPGYKGGKDALMDALLLSRCDYLVHTVSNVSDFVTYFNPDIKSVFLPKRITAKERICWTCLSNNKWYDKNF